MVAAIWARKLIGRALVDSHLSALLLHLGNATWAKGGLPFKQSPSVFPCGFTLGKNCLKENRCSHKPYSGLLQSWVGVAHQAFLLRIPQISKGWWVPPSFPPNYTHLGSLNTRVFLLTQPGTRFQMTRTTHCFMQRWRLRSAFCCNNTQMSSAKVFKKTDLLRPNFNHQWAVRVIILSHQSMPVSSAILPHPVSYFRSVLSRI